jgi:hypothetical protein
MSQELQKQPGNSQSVGPVINLVPTTQLDLSGLSPDAIARLQEQHAIGMVEIARKANELKVENASLAGVLSTMNTETTKATQSNVAITMTHTQTTSMGRTEIMIGNTDRAASGKLSPSASGSPDRTLAIVGIVIGGIILLAVLVGHH